MKSLSDFCDRVYRWVVMLLWLVVINAGMIKVTCGGKPFGWADGLILTAVTAYVAYTWESVLSQIASRAGR